MSSIDQRIEPVRVRVTAALAQLDAEGGPGSLDPRHAAEALIVAAHQAASAYSRQPLNELHAIADRVHRGLAPGPAAAPAPSSSSQAPSAVSVSKLLLAAAVAILSWATVAYLGRRGPITVSHIVGPLFCTAIAAGIAYRLFMWHRERRSR